MPRFYVRAVQLDAGTADRPGPWEQLRRYTASTLGEALTMAERADAGQTAANGGGSYVYGIRARDYAIARAEGIHFNEADGLLVD